MVLKKLGLFTTAQANDVTGISASGNDQQLKVLLLAIKNQHRTNRWGSRTEHYPIYYTDVAAGGPAGGESTFVYGHARLRGIWVQSASIFVQTCTNIGTYTGNFVTVSMYKDTTRDVSDVDNIGVDDSDSAFIIPETKVRSINGVDDGKHINLPVQMDYIAPGERWAFRIKAIPAGSGNTGWDIAHLTLNLAELHAT